MKGVELYLEGDFRAAARDVRALKPHTGACASHTGEVLAVIADYYFDPLFAMDLPHSDVCLVQAYPAERPAKLAGWAQRCLSSLAGVPRSILYDNTKLAVARILGDGTRRRTKVFSALQLFAHAPLGTLRAIAENSHHRVRGFPWKMEHRAGKVRSSPGCQYARRYQVPPDQTLRAHPLVHLDRRAATYQVA